LEPFPDSHRARLPARCRCRAKKEQISQSGPESGRGSGRFQVNLRTRHTLEPLAWHWSHWPGRLVNRFRGKCLFSKGRNPVIMTYGVPFSLGTGSGGTIHGGGNRCRANSAQLRQSRPVYGLDLSHFQVKTLKRCMLLPPRSILNPDPSTLRITLMTADKPSDFLYQNTLWFRGAREPSVFICQPPL